MSSFFYNFLKLIYLLLLFFNRGYLDGLCTILYDALRPFIIHINHLETLAEICSILRVEMLDEHVQNHRKFILIYFSGETKIKCLVINYS